MLYTVNSSTLVFQAICISPAQGIGVVIKIIWTYSLDNQSPATISHKYMKHFIFKCPYYAFLFFSKDLPVLKAREAFKNQLLPFKQAFYLLNDGHYGIFTKLRENRVGTWKNTMFLHSVILKLLLWRVFMIASCMPQESLDD